MNIQVMYSRKLTHSNYGGNNFETSDHSVSLSSDSETAEDLLLRAKGIVNGSVAREMASLTGGLQPQEWRKVLDRYLKEKTMASEEYERMSDAQKSLIQELKKSFKRNICQEKK